MDTQVEPTSPEPQAPEGILAWLLPAASAFAAASFALLAGVWAGPGCQTACQGDFDCLGEGFCERSTGRCIRQCFTDEDCRVPPSCRDDPTNCKPEGTYCTGNGRCQGSARIDLNTGTIAAPRGGGPRFIEGWDDPPGSGYAFIVEQIALAERNRGFDIDGRCDQNGCVDNILWPLGELANDQIRQGLLGGESLLLIELAGLDDEPYTGYDESLTVKVYGAEDADEPFFPANNFSVPPGHDKCCEFKINSESLVSPPPQARARAPAELERGRIRSLAPVPIQFTLTVGQEPHPVVRLENVLLNGRITRDLSTIQQGLLGGAIPVTTLFNTENPYCKTANPRCPGMFADSTLLDLVVGLLGPQPDVDLDLDGNECLLDTNGDRTIDLCCDGRGVGPICDRNTKDCGGRKVEPSDPSNPSSCAAPPQIDDGYSLALEFSALRAKIIAIGD